MSGTIILGQHRKFNMTSRVYGLDGIAPTLWSNMMKDPPRILVDRPEKERRCIQVATLDKVAYPQIEQHRRVYSIDAVSPTIPTCGGGGTQPNILVIGQLPGYEKNGRILRPSRNIPERTVKGLQGCGKDRRGGD